MEGSGEITATPRERHRGLPRRSTFAALEVTGGMLTLLQRYNTTA
jgi:hypothetical protein